MSAALTNVGSTQSQSSSVHKTSIWLRLLNWLAEKDGNYRQTVKLRAQYDERLQDMGITRRQANLGFYHKFGNKNADQYPIVLQRGL